MTTAICEMKTTLYGINDRLGIIGEKSSVLEDTAIETNKMRCREK